MSKFRILFMNFKLHKNTTRTDEFNFETFDKQRNLKVQLEKMTFQLSCFMHEKVENEYESK